MKLKLQAAAVLIGISLSYQNAHAGSFFLSGNDLYTYINGDNAYDKGSALGFVVGIADGEESQKRPRICISDQVTRGQVRDVVKKYLTEHPEQRHFTAASLVIESLMAAFPCQK